MPVLLSTVGALTLTTAVWFTVTQPVLSEAGTGIPVVVDPARLEAHVRMLSENCLPRDYRHPENLDRAAAYIRREFEQAKGVVTDQTYEMEEKTYRNVIAGFGPGTKERIVVGAHYDAFAELPGADDNASGVAGLIELAYLLGKAPPPIRVELVAFTLEEPKTSDGEGLFRTPYGGSAVHAASLIEQGVPVRLMLSLEMIGYFSDVVGSQAYPNRIFRLFYPSSGNFLLLVGRIQEGGFTRRLKKAMRAATSLPVYSVNAPSSMEGLDWSDHYNYWKHGFPAVMITDTAFMRNKKYHTAEDTPERLDYERMATAVQGVHAAVLSFSQ